VLGEVEVLVLHPARPSPVRHHLLAEAWKDHQTRRKDRAQALEVHRLIQRQDAVDYHQVRRLVHPQPRMVDARQRLGHVLDNAHIGNLAQGCGFLQGESTSLRSPPRDRPPRRVRPRCRRGCGWRALWV